MNGMVTWEQLYDALGIKDFIYFISSPSIQDKLFSIKLIFIFFTIFFLCAVVYFYLNSSFLQRQFIQDVTEFFSWQAYGLRDINRRWRRITKIAEGGTEADYKLAVIEADDFLYQVLEDRGYRGDTFEELLNDARAKVIPNFESILEAHTIRNSIVYELDYKLDTEKVKRILSDYEKTIKNISIS